MDLTLPLDYQAIERILPHRYPFLLVDRDHRIRARQADRRHQERVAQRALSVASTRTGRAALPPTILTEAVAQVGAILILAKPENRQRLPFFAGIQRVRYRRPVIPATSSRSRRSSLRLRSRMGLLKGVARVNGQRVVEGTMTFALGDPHVGRMTVNERASSLHERHSDQHDAAGDREPRTQRLAEISVPRTTAIIGLTYA